MRRKVSEEEQTIVKLSCLVHDRLGEYADCSGLIEAFDVVGNGSPYDRVPLCRCHTNEAGEAGSAERERFETSNWIDMRAEADRIAAMHSPPLGIRGLARDWYVQRIWSQASDRAKQARVAAGDQWTLREWMLDDGVREALFGWTRREMIRELGTAECMVEDAGGTVEEAMAHYIGGELGLDDETAMALCKAAADAEQAAMVAMMRTAAASGDGRGAQLLALDVLIDLEPTRFEWKRVRCVLGSIADRRADELRADGWIAAVRRDTGIDGAPVPGYQVLASRPIGGAT